MFFPYRLDRDARWKIRSFDKNLRECFVAFELSFNIGQANVMFI